MPKSLRNLGIIAYLVIFAGLGFFNKIVGLATDYLWFKELALTSVFTVTIFSKWGLGILSAVAAWLAIFINLRLARRWAKRGVIVVGEENIVEIPQLHEIRERARHILLVGSVVVVKINFMLPEPVILFWRVPFKVSVDSFSCHFELRNESINRRLSVH